MYIDLKSRKQAELESKVFYNELTLRISKFEKGDTLCAVEYTHYFYESRYSSEINRFVSTIEFVKDDNDPCNVEAYYYDRKGVKCKILDTELLNLISVDNMNEIHVTVTNEGFIIINNSDTIFATLDFGLYNLVTLDEILDAVRSTIIIDNSTSADVYILSIDVKEKNIILCNRRENRFKNKIPFNVEASFSAKYGGILFYAEGEPINYKIV